MANANITDFPWHEVKLRAVNNYGPFVESDVQPLVDRAISEIANEIADNALASKEAQEIVNEIKQSLEDSQ